MMRAACARLTPAPPRALRVRAFPRTSRGLGALLLACLTLLALAPALAARAQAVTGTVLSVGLGGNLSQPGRYRVGRYVPLLVRLENRSGGRLPCTLGVEQPDLDGDRVLCQSREVILEPSAEPRDVWLYYWPRPDDPGRGPDAVVVLDPQQRVLASIRTGLAPDARPGLQQMDALNNRGYQWVVLLGKRPVGLDAFAGSVGGGATVVTSWIDNASMFPDQALGLDGVDLIIWEADTIRPSELSADFQLAALLDWVQAGGHLVITLSNQAQELQTVSSRLTNALPATITGIRDIADGRLIADFAPGTSRYGGVTRIPHGPLRQLIAAPRAGGRALEPVLGDHADEPPLAITRAYGGGAITLLTTDVSAPDVALALSNTPGSQAVAFWQRVAGWDGQILTRDELKVANDERPDAVLTSPAYASLDADVAASIDLSKQTTLRLLLAVLFLGAYWVVAGPGGFLALRRYRRDDLNWWVFGATVCGAALLAILAVNALRLERYELRHRSFVLGTVNGNDTAVLSYYGLYAPVAGNVAIDLPPADGLCYLAPLNNPTGELIQGFADPQHYVLDNRHPGHLDVPFRSTLKKLEARWTGSLVTGLDARGLRSVVVPPPPGQLVRQMALTGTLTNRTGVALTDITLAAVDHQGSFETRMQGEDSSGLFDLDQLAPGETIDLEQARLAQRLVRRPGSLADNLAAIARVFAGGIDRRMSLGAAALDQKTTTMAAREKHPADLLNVLEAARPVGDVFTLAASTNGGRVGLVRALTSGLDRSAAWRASGLVIIAHSAGDATPAPLPLTVDGRELSGVGKTLYVFTATLE